MTLNVSFSSHSPHIAHVFSCMFFLHFEMMLYDFLAISIWDVFVKLTIISVVKSISFGSKIHHALYLNVLLIASRGVQAGVTF